MVMNWKKRLNDIRMIADSGRLVKFKGPHMPSEEFRRKYGKDSSYAAFMTTPDVWRLVADMERELELLQRIEQEARRFLSKSDQHIEDLIVAVNDYKPLLP